MDALFVSGLTSAFLVIANKLAEKIFEIGIERTEEEARQALLKNFTRKKAEGELHDAVMRALDITREQEVDAFDRLKLVKAVTGKSPEVYELLAATAVEMVRPEPKKIPSQLLLALGMEDTYRELLMRFLLHFRKQLVSKPQFTPLIDYANKMDDKGSLVGFAISFVDLHQEARRMRTNLDLLAAHHGLTKNDKEALNEYLQYMRQKLGTLRLPLIRENVGLVSAAINRVFVPLSLRDEQAEETARKKSERRGFKLNLRLDVHEETTETIKPIDFNDLFARYRRFILIGLPGTGKTTLLRRAALAFADGRNAEDLKWKEPMFPIFLRLHNFGIFLDENREKFCEPAAGSIIAYMEQHLRNDENINLPADFFEKRLNGGKCVVLMDGLDEISDNRMEVAQHISRFIEKYSPGGNRFGISSRPKGYYDEEVQLQFADSNLAVAVVNPLTPQGISQLIKNLFPLIEPDPVQREKDIKNLTQKILSHKDLAELASIPLFCSTLVQVYKHHGADLPQRRVDVLAEIENLLLGFWYVQQRELRDAGKLARADGTDQRYDGAAEAVEIKRNRLAHLAFHMHADLRQETVSDEDARKAIENYLVEQEGATTIEAKRWAKKFLQNAHEHSGLFMENEPGTYAFIHKNFLEYFAATALITDQDDPVQIILDNIQDPWWDQVILLACAHRDANNPFRRDIIPRILSLAGQLERGSPAWSRVLMMAGGIARDMTTRLPTPKRRELEQVLEQAAKDELISPQVRADKADALDELGYTPEDLYHFINIRSDDFSRSGATEVATTEDFYIGKYPVTNLQYEHFLERKNFEDKTLWCGFPKFSEPDKDGRIERLDDWGAEGWDWLQEMLKREREDVQDGILFPRFWRDPRFGIARRAAPVVGISWYEANAYCKWLAANWENLEEGKLGLDKPGELRLPTEKEWETAAGGTRLPSSSGRGGGGEGRFAWDEPGEVTSGDEVLRFANTSESGINRTTPVWMYPQGESYPYKLMDMSGNVWEWQANFYDKDHDVLGLRGGSWNDLMGLARVSARSYFYPPGHLWSRIGFRLVGVFPPS